MKHFEIKKQTASRDEALRAEYARLSAGHTGRREELMDAIILWHMLNYGRDISSARVYQILNGK